MFISSLYLICLLTPSGQQTSETVNPHPVSSSDVQAPPLGGMTFGKPRPLTIAEVEDVVNRFAFAAKALHDVSILRVILAELNV